MRILIVTKSYPSPQNYADSRFIHERVIEYAKIENVQVLVTKINNKLNNSSEYIHEGIVVKAIRTEYINEVIEQYQPDIIGIHFFEGSLIKALIPKTNVPIIVWVHGVEAIGWYRRLFDFSLSIAFLKSIRRNSLQLWNFRKLIKISNTKANISFIFVSNWMKKTTATDTLSTIKYFDIVPNPIDTELFKYQEKSPDLRKNILIIRSFESKKYANDIAIEAILLLSSHRIFQELNFEIFGDLQYFDSLTDPLKKFPNVTLHKRFVEHDRIPAIHERHGVFLCPTRQDSHGVSMCEAMASGLVPITSNNSAIPEFVQDNYSGFLTESYIEIAERIVQLYDHPDTYLTISANAATAMQNICAKQVIIDQEMRLMRDKISRNK